jgi:hypothetical protein
VLQTLVAANDVQKFDALQLFKVVFTIIKRSKIGDKVWNYPCLDTHQSVAWFRNIRWSYWTLSDNVMLHDWDGLQACHKCFERLLEFISKSKQQLRPWLWNHIFKGWQNQHSSWNFQKLFQKSETLITREQRYRRTLQIRCSTSLTLRWCQQPGVFVLY